MLAAIDLTRVLDTLIITLPAIIAAVYAGRIHRMVKTPSGDPIGHVVERAHEVGIANNLLLSRANGETRLGTHDELRDTAPQVPDNEAEPEP